MKDTPASGIDFARHDRIRLIRWTGQSLELLDQRRLPFEVEYLACANSGEVAAAIHALAVRGAPAIGIAAAWGAVLAAQEFEAADGSAALVAIEPALQPLNTRSEERREGKRFVNRCRSRLSPPPKQT